VASTPGGGFDTFARILSKYMGKYIPGNPTLIVENMPGAGHVLAANMIYNTGRKDGTVMVNFSSAPIMANFFDDPGVQFDSTQYNWLGLRELDHVACAVSRASGFNRLEEATGGRQLIIGGLAPSSNTDTVPNLLRNLIGLNIKVVSGYPGVPQIRLGVESNELHGVCFSWSGMKSTWREELAAGEVKVIAQAGVRPHPDLPNVPQIQELAKTDEQRQLIEAGIILPLKFAQAYAVPPGVPPERVQALREAYQTTLKDPEFVVEAQRANFEIDPVSGVEIQEAINKLFALPPETRAKLAAAFEP
jgi:tripartite-type tricarboxylate transporter receptor subunit TctC